MDIGVFVPINGWIISLASPQYIPSFELKKKVVSKAGAYRLDLALSMIKRMGLVVRPRSGTMAWRVSR
jgi:pyrimidine oxygenase